MWLVCSYIEKGERAIQRGLQVSINPTSTIRSHPTPNVCPLACAKWHTKSYLFPVPFFNTNNVFVFFQLFMKTGTVKSASTCNKLRPYYFPRYFLNISLKDPHISSILCPSPALSNNFLAISIIFLPTTTMEISILYYGENLFFVPMLDGPFQRSFCYLPLFLFLK